MLSTATRALVGVMAEQKVHRLVCITGMGAGDSRGHGGFFYDRLFLPLMLRKVYEDKDRQEDAIRASALDWIIVRPTVLSDKPARGRIRALTDLSGVHGGTIARQCRGFRRATIDRRHMASKGTACHLVKCPS